jgi:invasion protein IalB
MYELKLHTAWLVPFAALIATSGHATAQQRTTATYEDWVLQCETQAGPPPQKICDIAQVTQVQGKNLPFSRVAVRRPVKGQPVNLEVQLPVNTWLLSNVRVLTSDADPGLAAPFQRCIPNGCFAEFELKDDMMKKLRGTGTTGKIIFKDSTNHDVTVPLSFKGFSQAFDALLKE